MRLVRIRRAVYDVVAIADDSGHSLWKELKDADPSDSGAEQMRARLKEKVPREGPPKGQTRCRHVGDDIWEFKERGARGVRVLWFWDAGVPNVRKRILCTHMCAKVNDKEFQREKAKAVRIRRDYLAAKAAGKLKEPEEPKWQKGDE